MVTHYRGPRPRGWVLCGHLCKLWAYIGAPGLGDSHPPAALLRRDEGGCGEYPRPSAAWSHGGSPVLVVPPGKERQPPTLSQLVPTSLLVPVKGLPLSCLPPAV